MNRNFHGQQVDKSASNNHPYQYADGQPLEEELFAYNNAYQYDGTLENASVYQQTYTEQPYQQLEHHQQHEQVHQALIQSYSQHDNPPAIGNEPVAEVEEAEEEEEAPVQEPKSRPREVAATRAARTRRWPKKSDAPVTYASYEEYKASLSEDELKPVEIARGLAGPRNLFAVFDDRGPEKRLIRNIKLIKARSTQDYPGFKDPKVHHLPMGISLPEICVHYPLHVWGDGLRLFICEGMDAKDIYNNLPVTARNNKQNGRPHNYLQQAMGREADSMFLEAGGKKRTIQKRKRPAADEEEVEDSGAGYDHQSSPIAAEGSLPTGQYSPDPMTMPMPTPMPAFLQMSPTGQAAYDGFPDAAPIMYQPHPVPTGYGPAQDFRSQQLADTSRAHSASDTAHRDFPYPADDLPSVLQQNGRAKKRRLVDTASLSFPTSETTEMVPSASGLGIHYGAQQPAVNNRFQQPNWTSSYPPVHPAQMHRRQHVSPDQTSQSSSALPMQNPKSAALMPQQTDDFDDHAGEDLFALANSTPRSRTARGFRQPPMSLSTSPFAEPWLPNQNNMLPLHSQTVSA